MTTPKLEPCPFCASRKVEMVEVIYCPRSHYVYCNNCGAGGSEQDTPERALAYWNTRKGGDK